MLQLTDATGGDMGVIVVHGTEGDGSPVTGIWTPPIGGGGGSSVGAGPGLGGSIGGGSSGGGPLTKIEDSSNAVRMTIVD